MPAVLTGGAKLPWVRAPAEVGTLVTEPPPALLADGGGEASDERPRLRRSEQRLDQPRWTVADTLIVVALVVVGVGLPAGIALWSHAFGIPRYDDWAYRRVLAEFVQTGHISLVGWGAMTLVGQLFWAAPFALILGGHPWVAGFSVAIASAIGIGSAYWLARAVLKRPAWGAGCTLLALAAPGFLVNTSTFMTDLPAFSAEVTCLALGVAALGRRGRARWALLAASMAVGCAGFSVREFDLAAPVAVLVTLAMQDRIRGRDEIEGAKSAAPPNLWAHVAMGTGLVALCAAIYVWTWALSGAQHEGLGLPTVSALRAVAEGYFALALFVAPFLPAAARQSWSVRPSRRGIVAASVICGIGVVLIVTGKSLFSGNYLTQQGMSTTATLPGFRPVLFPGPVWALLEVLGVCAGTVLGFLVAEASYGSRAALRSWGAGEVAPRTIVILFIWLSGLGLVLYGLFVRGPIFDRYVWPLAFATAILLASKAINAGAVPLPAPAHVIMPPPRRSRWTALAASGGRPDIAVVAATVALTLVAGAVAISVSLNADSYDGARWSAGQIAIEAGARADAVDAGFDWVGSHATTPAVRARQLAGLPSYVMWYDELFSKFRDCAFVSGSVPAPHGTSLIGRVRYNEVGFAVPEYLYIYVVRASSCP